MPAASWLSRISIALLIALSLLSSMASAATFTVTKTADTNDGICDADCSLREAIVAANALAGQDTIAFSIPGPAPHTVQPISALPTITDPVIIDGTTEPDFAGSPIVELDGSLVSWGVAGLTAHSRELLLAITSALRLLFNRTQARDRRLLGAHWSCPEAGEAVGYTRPA